MKRKWHSRFMSDAPLLYTLVSSAEEWHKLCKWLKITPMPPFLGTAHATTTRFENEDGEGIAVVAMEISNDEVQDLALLVHEAVHVWQFICQEIGEKKPSSEFEAYSMQTICHNLFVDYMEKKNEIAKQAEVQRNAKAKQEEEQLVDKTSC